MTATVLSPATTTPSEPSLSAAVGRFLVLAGAVFGIANLFQFGVLSGLLHLHPAVLSLSWPLAVAGFLIVLFRMRRSPSATVRRAAIWSRFALAGQISGALILLGLSIVLKDWTIMRAMSVVGMALSGVAWIIAAVRTRTLWTAGLAAGCLGASAGIALLLGTPAQYLAYGLSLFAFALTPGLILMSGGDR